MVRPPVLVLMYHQIVPDSMPRGWVPSQLADSRYGVRVSDFWRQMEVLAERGIPVVSLSDWLDGRCMPGPLSGTVCMLTFDDGYSSDHDQAAPVLDSMGFPATFFVSTGFLGMSGMLTPDKMVRLCENPLFRVGSHGVSHRFLSQLSEEECRMELSGSFSLIRELSGQKEVDLSAPGGRFGPNVIRLATDAGFRSLMTSEAGIFQSGDDLFSIPRLPVMSHHSVAHFVRLSDPASLAFRLDRWKRNSRKAVRKLRDRADGFPSFSGRPRA
ncbi:MAG: polysaccharide deacetylase family protein [Leptospirales bacterium]